MVWIKHFPVSTKTFQNLRAPRCCQFSSSVDKQISSSASLSESDGAGSKETIMPVKMAYTEYTSPNVSPNSPPLIIMHGLLGSRTNWKSLSKAIHARTKLKVLAVDARNHGDSEHSPEMSYAHIAEDVRQFMQDHKILRAAMLGHSMGGRAMMAVALKYPALVSRLIVVDISPVGASPALSLMSRYFDAMEAVSLPANVSAAEARALADKQLQDVVTDKGVRQFILTNLIQGEDGRYKWRLNLGALARTFSQIATFPMADQAPKYGGPTLFIAGGDSDYIPDKSHEATRKIFPAARFQKIDDAGHWVHAEKPHEFLDIVGPFLDPSP